MRAGPGTGLCRRTRRQSYPTLTLTAVLRQGAPAAAGTTRSSFRSAAPPCCTLSSTASASRRLPAHASPCGPCGPASSAVAAAWNCAGFTSPSGSAAAAGSRCAGAGASSSSPAKMSCRAPASSLNACHHSTCCAADRRVWPPGAHLAARQTVLSACSLQDCRWFLRERARARCSHVLARGDAPG